MVGYPIVLLQCSMIGYWRDMSSVRLSVCLSVTKCIVVLRVGVGVEGCTLLFLGGHFLFISSDTFAVGCIIQPQYTQKKRTAEISASGIVMRSVVTRPWPFQTRHFQQVRFYSYTLRRPQYDRPS